MRILLGFVFCIPVAIVLRSIVGENQPWFVHLSIGSVSFMLAYTFASSFMDN